MELLALGGVSTENPELTMPALIAAQQQGYRHIGLSIRTTRDSRFVLLKDATLNRTARHPGGAPLTHPVPVAQVLWEQLRHYDMGVGFARKFQGTEPLLLEQVLPWAKAEGMHLKLTPHDFSPTQWEALLRLLAPWADTAELTCSDENTLRQAAALPGLRLHYEGAVTPALAEFGSRLTLWLTEPEIQKLPSGMRLGLKYGSTPEQAEALGAAFLETAGQWKPAQNQGVLGDMHTHSEHSHDSVAKIGDMARSAAQKGVRFLAVTDHCDIYHVPEGDNFSHIRRSGADAARTGAVLTEPVTVLRGVEIGEGFWYPDAQNTLLRMQPYDVIVGGEHNVRSAYADRSFAKIDFSGYTTEQLHVFLTDYFDHVLKMLRSLQPDILAHLTCPLRYILYKYQKQVDMTLFEPVIGEILRYIIDHGIALEVNTSYLKVMGDFLPGREILKRYREMGGYLITLGSDAHKPDKVRGGFDEALDCLRQLGFREVFYYQKRIAYPCTIL